MKNFSIEIKWGLIFVIMTLLWMVLEKAAGFHDTHIAKHEIFTNFIAIPAITLYVFALLDKRKNFYGGFMTYKQAFISGLIITLVVTLFTPLTQYITSIFITPDYFINAIDDAVKNKKRTLEEAQDFFNLKNYIILSTITAPVMGLITTAIISFFTKTKLHGKQSISI